VRYEIVSFLEGGLFGFQNPVVETTIELARSEDEGRTWSSPVAVSPTVRIVYTGAAEGEQFGQEDRVVQGSQPLVAEDGTLYVAWLDSTDDSAFEGLAEIWVARSEDGGRTFAKPVVAANFLEPDFSPRTAFFRSWGGTFPQLASGPDGDISMVYVARPPGKPADDGDVYYIRSEDGGRSWTRPERVNDDVTNAFQFFPAVSVDPKGVVHAMWGDFRDDKSEKRYNIYYSKSEDEGETWLENTIVTDYPSNPNFAFPNGIFIGDYFAIEATEDNVYMVWADGRLGELGVANQKIAFARLSPIRLPSIFLSPPSGAGGKDVVIQGFDFQPEQDIFLEVSGAVVSSGRTDLDGKFSMRTFVPISGEGAHDIRVFDASGNVATASFYMEFGFDTIENRLQKTVRDLQASILGAPPSENITGIQDAIVFRIDSMQDTLVERISAIEENVNGQMSPVSPQIWGVAAIAIVAIVISVYSLIMARRLRST
ncbi:MAG: sialidase family protein, partial [Nitrososphaerales archaeon]